MPIPSNQRVHGTQLETPGSKRLDPMERLAYRVLFDTIVDCHMISRGRWQHFKHADWSPRTSEHIWKMAVATTLAWINSDEFAFYLMHFGWDRLRARAMLCEVLNGKHKDLVQRLMDPHQRGDNFFKRG